jgi:hypothetical protein
VRRRTSTPRPAGSGAGRTPPNSAPSSGLPDMIIPDPAGTPDADVVASRYLAALEGHLTVAAGALP